MLQSWGVPPSWRMSLLAQKRRRRRVSARDACRGMQLRAPAGAAAAAAAAAAPRHLARAAHPLLHSLPPLPGTASDEYRGGEDDADYEATIEEEEALVAREGRNLEVRQLPAASMLLLLLAPAHTQTLTLLTLGG